MNREPLRWVTPDWNLPSVRVISTLRCGGVSDAAYESLNLATHVGDRGESVTENRRLLRKVARLPQEPFWLEQVHGARVVLHDDSTARPKADASVAFSAGQVCAVLTADCLPVVFTDRTGSRIAVAHAGWRGLLAGVLTATVRALRSDPANLLAWLGPAISSDAFEVGGEVRDAFMLRHDDFSAAFVANAPPIWADPRAPKFNGKTSPSFKAAAWTAAIVAPAPASTTRSTLFIAEIWLSLLTDRASPPGAWAAPVSPV